jgi:single-stranded DNA-binding protein
LAIRNDQQTGTWSASDRQVGATPRIASIAGVTTVSFSIVTEAISFWTDDDGRRQTKRRTTCFRVIAHEARVVNAIKATREGDMISIDGTIERRTFVSDGVERDIVEIVAEDVLSSVKKPF